MPHSFPLTSSEIKAKQADLLAKQRVRRIQQVRQQEKQQAFLKTQLYKENCQEFARQETAFSELQWEVDSRQALGELQHQLQRSLTETGAGHAAAQQAQLAAAKQAEQKAAQRDAHAFLAQRRFAHALQLRHAEQSAAVQPDAQRLQRLTDAKAAESQRAHLLAQKHRATQAEEALNSVPPVNVARNDAALRSIDYHQTRLHELGGAALVQRNTHKGQAHHNIAAESAAAVQLRYSAHTVTAHGITHTRFFILQISDTCIDAAISFSLYEAQLLHMIAGCFLGLYQYSSLCS